MLTSTCQKKQINEKHTLQLVATKGRYPNCQRVHHKTEKLVSTPQEENTFVSPNDIYRNFEEACKKAARDTICPNQKPPTISPGIQHWFANEEWDSIMLHRLVTHRQLMIM